MILLRMHGFGRMRQKAIPNFFQLAYQDVVTLVTSIWRAAKARKLLELQAAFENFSPRDTAVAAGALVDIRSPLSAVGSYCRSLTEDTLVNLTNTLISVLGACSTPVN